MTEIKVGDEVRVHDGYSVTAAPVVSVGRTLVTLKIHGREEKFRLDTQRWNGQQVGHGRWFTTPEQDVLADRKDAALSVLKERGIELSHRHTFTLEQIETLAEVAGTFTEQEG